MHKRFPGLVAIVAVAVTAAVCADADAATSVIPSGATQLSVSVGGVWGCVVTESRTVECWGENEYGQLGNGSTTPSQTPVRVSGLTGVREVSVGGDHACALLESGGVRCWGADGSGQLGNGTVSKFSPVPVAVTGINDAVDLSAGDIDACVVLEDGTARCWGWNREGNLGDGTEEDRSTPVTVAGLTAAISIRTGVNQSCALLADGSVRCWGRNGYEGTLGNGTETDSLTPVPVSGIHEATGLSSTFDSCVTVFDGSVWCWGWNTYGTLGNGSNARTLTPVRVSGLSNARQVSVGLQHTCAVLTDTTVWCWGQNFGRQLGNGETTDASAAPVESNISGVLAVAAGREFTCALLNGGSVECWGSTYGPLPATAGGSTSTGGSGPGPANPGGTDTIPTVKITSHPPKETADQGASFNFTGTAGGAYECSVDTGSWKACTSGEDFGPLQPGDHRFEVREVLKGMRSAPASYSWTIDLPKACILKVARARVFAFTHQDKARLIIRYKAYTPAQVTVSYSLTGTRGALALGSATARFKTAGIFRLGETFGTPDAAKVKAARSMTVKFSIPQAPSSCARYYTKRLTIPKKVFGQTVWFQSDSIFGPGV